MRFHKRYRIGLVDKNNDDGVGACQMHSFCKRCRVNVVKIQVIEDVIYVET